MEKDDKIPCLECDKKFRSITNTHLAKHGLTELSYREKHGASVPLRCASYLEQLRQRPSYVRTDEWRKNASEAKKGKKNPRYRNGNPYKNKGYGNRWQYYWRIEALRRDNFECQNCGLDQDGHYQKYGSSLHVHHIDREDDVRYKNHSLENLKTLCKSCHVKEDNALYESEKHPKDKTSGRFV